MKMWSHQQKVVPLLADRNFLLFWEAGVGKTLPMLHAAHGLRKRALYLGPPAIRTQVAKEAQASGLYRAQDVQVIRTGKDRVAPQAKLVVCSYDHLIDPKVWKQLFSLDWGALILDEGHLLKNSGAKRTRAVYGARISSPGALTKKALRVWVATGTPITNDPSDLWTHLSRLMPNRLAQAGITTKTEFLQRFCHLRDTPYGAKVVGGKNLPELARLLDGVSDRVKKTDVLDLPPLLVSQVWVPPDDLDLSDVPEEAVATIEAIMQNDDLSKLELLEAPLATMRRQIGLAKAPHAAEMALSEIDGGVWKSILFYQHTEVGRLIYDTLTSTARMRDAVVMYTGGMSQTKRDAVVESFTRDPNVRILVAQIQAAGTGLNLQAAERVMIVEPAWTPALNEQAISRAYRGGQKRRVWASYVCIEDTVDEDITDALIRKAKIIKEVVG